ncbi:MAG: HNH endonuclease [Patescibacteria group bacterium]
MNDFLDEQWVEIEGHSNVFISTHGRIKSINKTYVNYGNVRAVPDKYYKQQKLRNGYWFIKLGANNKKINYMVHRLVAKAFIHNPENKPQVNHKNSIRHDNRVENLEWCTRSENAKHGVLAGNIKPPISKLKGEQCHLSKLKDADIQTIFNLYKYGIGIRKISEQFSVDQNTVIAILDRSTWKHLHIDNMVTRRKRPIIPVNAYNAQTNVQVGSFPNTTTAIKTLSNRTFVNTAYYFSTRKNGKQRTLKTKEGIRVYLKKVAAS